jgi:hypothetical protein
VSQNGATHGIYSKLVVLNNEDHSMYVELRESHLREWAPVTETEHDLVIDIVDARWKLRRFQTFETAALDFEVHRLAREIDATFEEIDEETRTMLCFNSLLISNRTFQVLQVAIRNQHRTIDRAITQLLRLRKLRNAGDLNSERTDSTATGNKPSAPAPAPEPTAAQDAANEPQPRTEQSTGNPKVENSGSKPERQHSRSEEPARDTLQPSLEASAEASPAPEWKPERVMAAA